MILEDIQKHLKNQNVKLIALRQHLKASEQYVDVIFVYPGEGEWNGSVPYYYRRANLFLENSKDVAQLLEKTYEALKKGNASKWVDTERKLWKTEYKGRNITKSFFDKLLNLRWNSVESDFPANPNWARRIQDIKEMGYVLATDTNRYNKKLQKKTTHLILLPLEKGPQTGYEIISPQLRKRIIKVLRSYDAYEGKIRPSHLLLPDHKFPEISWDETIREKNSKDMTDEEIREKFQLLDNQRNLEKREACRKVVQTGKHGTIFGIKYYLGENEFWPSTVPKVGREAEKGWAENPWYDIEVWRQSLNEFIASNRTRNNSKNKKLRKK